MSDIDHKLQQASQGPWLTKPRVITPAEAKQAPDSSPVPSYLDLLHTVTTEPDRVRAAVVEELRFSSHWLDEQDPVASLRMRAEAIESGANF